MQLGCDAGMGEELVLIRVAVLLEAPADVCDVPEGQMTNPSMSCAKKRERRSPLTENRPGLGTCRRLDAASCSQVSFVVCGVMHRDESLCKRLHRIMIAGKVLSIVHSKERRSR
jgi:hypothetical protein